MVVSGLVAVALAVLAIYPLLQVISRLFVVDGRLDLSAFGETLGLPGLGELLFNTFVLVLASSLAALVIGAGLAWLNERTDARIGVFTDVMPMLPFLLPPVAGAVGWVLLLSPSAGLLNSLIRDALGAAGMTLESGPLDIHTWYGLILVFTIYQVPYVFLMVSTGLRNLDPSLEEQSRISGAGLLSTIRTVTLPGVRPSLGAAILLMIWSGFGLFSVPAIIGTGARIEVISVQIVQLLTTYPPRTGVAVGLSVFVMLFVATAWYAQIRVLRGGRHATVSGKGHRETRIELGGWRVAARALMAGYLLVATILPMLALLFVSLNGFWTADMDWSRFSLDALRESLLEDSITQRALRNSLTLGGVGATVGMVAAAIVALFILRVPQRVGQTVDAAIKMPSVLSNIVVAVGIVLAFAGPPFRLAGTTLILLTAYVVLYMPQGSVAADAAASQVGKELPEASHVAGAGGARTFRNIQLPVMLPGLVAGWALLFVRMVGDLTASSMLAGTRNPVVGFRILEVYQNGSYALLASLATALTVITSTVLALVLWFSRRAARRGLGSGSLGVRG